MLFDGGNGLWEEGQIFSLAFSWTYCNLHLYLIWWNIQLDISAKLLHLDDFSRAILSQFTEEQMSRYESFRRAGFQKSNMKKVCFSFFFSPYLLLPLSLGLYLLVVHIECWSVPILINWPVPIWCVLVKMCHIHFCICIKIRNCLHVYPMVWMQLLASITGTQKISVPMTIVVSGIAKMFVGELVETGMHTVQFWIYAEISFQGWQLFTFG